MKKKLSYNTTVIAKISLTEYILHAINLNMYAFNH